MTGQSRLLMPALRGVPMFAAGVHGTRTADDGQPYLPSGGHAELPGGGQRDDLV
jgi:hypothetical protein